MKKIDTVIFDLDGTLLDTLEDLAVSVNEALTMHGYPKRTLEEVRMFVGNGVRKLMERALPGGLENPEFETCLADFRAHYSEHMQDHTKPYEGITELLTILKEKGYRTAIVSNKFDAAVKGLKEQYFAGLIEVAVGESEKVRKKPAPDSVFGAMKELGAEKETCIYVGDSDVDVETAHNSGMECIGVTWGFRDRQVLSTAGSDYIVDNTEELLQVLWKTGKEEEKA